MNFSTDRDLLAIEPQVFQDVPLLSQQRLQTQDASIAGTTLSSASADFISTGVSAGSVVLVNEAALEVIARTDAHTLTVSLLRTLTTDPAMAPTPGDNQPLSVRTFAPQAALMHDLLLRMVGIEPDDPTGPLSEASIISRTVMRRLETLGVLERIYSAAAQIVGEDQALWKKASYYRERFGNACDRALVLLDANGDGIADLRRSPSLIQLHRA